MSRNTTNDTSSEEYEVLPVVPVIEGPSIHNKDGFCYDLGCECHDNQESIADLHQAHQAGLVSDTDRDNIYQGKTF